MKCKECPLYRSDRICAETKGDTGFWYADGSRGCIHHWIWVEKKLEQMDLECKVFALDLSIKIVLTEREYEGVIDLCKHMVGLDNSHPYHRNGAAFYKAYRNYFTDGPDGNELLDKLPSQVIHAEKTCRGGTFYSLTAAGISWLSRQLKIKITERK